jgi:hypothetical protein
VWILQLLLGDGSGNVEEVLIKRHIITAIKRHIIIVVMHQHVLIKRHITISNKEAHNSSSNASTPPQSVSILQMVLNKTQDAKALTTN